MMMSVGELFLHGIRWQITRITICRVLINNPVILFGDELTGALNTKATIDVMNISIS
ncbi:ABC-type lipoprotein export system ATPase subunit [Lysinibacillus parviboronicapiens]|uniref:ABC-type lipoprotein export system ATPase subunit n=1 Tax=Lysinibacillus parviboronicapiens TaxID=436516 RepID=A0ABV2PGE4_9BACI